MTNSEILQFIDQMRPRDRGTLFNRAVGVVGVFVILVVGIPLWGFIPIGSSIGQYLGLGSLGCYICIAVYFAITIFVWAHFITRYLRWKLLSYMKSRLQAGVFQPCPVCNSIKTDETQTICECGCRIRYSGKALDDNPTDPK